MDLENIIKTYHETFPKYSKLLINSNCIEGIWVITILRKQIYMEHIRTDI